MDCETCGVQLKDRATFYAEGVSLCVSVIHRYWRCVLQLDESRQLPCDGSVVPFEYMFCKGCCSISPFRL